MIEGTGRNSLACHRWAAAVIVAPPSHGAADR